MISLSSLSLISVGIDVGSTTSHFVISRLTLLPVSSDPDSKLEVKRREILYLSDVVFTPYTNSDQIDGEEIYRFIKSGYSKINLSPDNVDVGAIIVTGVAARKENAERVATSISGLAGDFVCVAAGPRLEAILSAYGSGAIALSAERHDHSHDHEHDEPYHEHDHDHSHQHDNNHSPETVLNVDIGGGTTKLAISRRGRIVETAALNVGARLVKWDGQGVITGIEPPALQVASMKGIELEQGRSVDYESLQLIAEQLVSSIFELILYLSGGTPLSDLTKELLITGIPSYKEKIEKIVFSGGVSEYIYGHESREHGDMGVIMGRIIAERFRSGHFGMSLGRPLQFIRATVIGASHYTCQVSGNTVFISNSEDLPVRNALMIPVELPDNLQSVGTEKIAKRFLDALAPYDEQESIAFLVNTTMLGHDGIRALSTGIISGLGKRLAMGRPLILVFNANVGRQLGLALKEQHEVRNSVICVDEIQPEGMAYIDIGRPVDESGPLPVVIKSLIFDDTGLAKDH